MSIAHVAPGWEVAPLGRRVGARCVGALINLVFFAGLYAPVLFMRSPSSFLLWIAVWAGSWVVAALYCDLKHAATFGQAALGLKQLDAATGLPSGGRTFLKYFLMWLLTQLTCGLMLLLSLFSYTGPQQRSWWDRMAGVVVGQRSRSGPGAVPVTKAPAVRDIPPLPAIGSEEPVAVPPQRRDALATPPSPPPDPDPALLDSASRPSWAVPSASDPSSLVADRPLDDAATSTAFPAATLLLDDGTSLSLDRAWVLGRDPQAPPTRPDAVPHRVDDPQRSLSKTHLLVEVDNGKVRATDLHSTNGVTVRHASGLVETAKPGVATPVPAGATVSYGSRTLRVSP